MSDARDNLTGLGWTSSDHDSSSYNRGVFRVLEALVADGERLQAELAALRAELRLIGFVQSGGEAE